MLAHRYAGLLWLLALLGCDGTRNAVEPVAQPPAPPGDSRVAVPSASGDRPPGPDGWGQAEGLHYLELLRGGAAADDSLPMIVLIHGLGDQPTPAHFGEFDVPVRVILPRAPKPYYGGFSWFEYRVADADEGALAAGIRRAADQLARALKALSGQRPTRGRPIVTGFSQGGMLTFALALHHPELVHAAHPIAGMLPRPLWPDKGPGGTRFPPITASHGDADQIVPIDPARALTAHLRSLGYSAELREFPDLRHQISAPVQQAMHAVLLGAVASLGSE